MELDFKEQLKKVAGTSGWFHNYIVNQTSQKTSYFYINKELKNCKNTFSDAF